jgi:hypothetical protein
MSWRRRRAWPLAGVLLLAGCVTEVTRDPGGPRVEERPAVSLTLRSDRAEYASGQPVELALELVNRGRGPLFLTVPTSQLYEFTIARDGQEIWRWSAGKLFLAQVTDVLLGPGQTGLYKVVWDGKDKDGRPVVPGRYVATGVWIGGQQVGLQPLSLPITVR